MGAAVVAVVLIAGATFLTGWADFVRDPDGLLRAIHDVGSWGPLLYVLLMALIVGVGVPGILFAVPASILWPAPVAIAVFVAGGMAASCIRFVFVRSVGRRWVEARLPDRFRRWDARLSGGGLRTVVVTRLLFNLAAPADWILALSRVTTQQFLVGTLVGRTPVAVALVLGGDRVRGWLSL